MKFLILFLFSFFLLFSFNSFTQTSNLKDYLDTAALFKESGEYERAIDILETAKDFSKNLQLLKYQARLEFLSGRSSQALGFFNNIKDKDWQSFLYLGLIYEDLGEEALAIENYSKSLGLRVNTIAYFRLGKIYRKKGDYKKAAKYFSGLVKFDPSVRLAYYYLGECLYQDNNCQEAYKFLAKAINFYPKDRVVSEKLKAVKQSLGEDFFRARKKKEEERRKKVRLTAYVQEEGIPLVRVGLARGAEKFSFSCPGNFLISDGKDSYSALANKFYTLALVGERITLRGYQDKKEYKSFSGPLNITSLESKEVKFPFYVLCLSSGKGDFWNRERDRAYRGDLEITTKAGALTLVNILSVEEYLYGVLSAEMSSKAHAQALRAQAVAARTFVFRNLGRHKQEGFNFCPLVHCQVYQGISAQTPSTIAAVRDTRGEVIVYKDRPIEALFHAHCGGCLASDVFGESDYLEEKMDSFDASTLLSINPEQAKCVEGRRRRVDLGMPDSAYSEEEWFFNSPLVFCSKDKGSKFRWQRVYDDEDFSIAFGEKLEDLKDILLKEKGDCFHYKEIEVIISEGSKDLRGDLNIRNYFDHLRSSAFKIEKKLSAQGQPSMLFFWGAGFGHGAGMCQDGAVGMAEAGYSWQQIINHYFPNTEIKKLY